MASKRVKYRSLAINYSVTSSAWAPNNLLAWWVELMCSKGADTTHLERYKKANRKWCLGRANDAPTDLYLMAFCIRGTVIKITSPFEWMGLLQYDHSMLVSHTIIINLDSFATIR